MKDNPEDENPLSSFRAPEQAGPVTSKLAARVAPGHDVDENLEDFIEDDEMDAEADFAEG
jgi:hypothetical protein